MQLPHTSAYAQGWARGGRHGACAETIVEMVRAQLAECEEMIALGVARPGTAEHVDMILTLLATFAAQKSPDLARIRGVRDAHPIDHGDAFGISR